ncbi:GTP-binding protein HSR1 [Antribacter sp. KLBMP9083]|uniref:GTP-binding protein HSR1 n=1 Tax=Antribacter soli TaxID=2910976 RepID=A0AA41QAJ0_9MICO|nr:GTP-binding protein HSR1 [Antribacter soli]MCF4119723.1 GTP-binding protein HSR1 [Antribacter soli]
MSRLDLVDRTSALETAASEAEGRLAQALVDDARAVINRARERGGLSAEHTVVALAGATGSGKSSVFNAVAGQDIAVPGVRRPTTSHALAAVWGDGADPLLDWLDVPRRHLMAGGDLAEAEPAASGTAPARSASPGSAAAGDDPGDGVHPGDRPASGSVGKGLRGLFRRRTPAGDVSGLVLLDLPDHDSVMTDHRVRAERLVARADLLVWVVDPQKYADAALHEGFLRPLAGRADVVVVALNQVDRLASDETEAMLADLRRLLADDGLAGARVMALSARTGQGVDALHGLLAQAAAKREAANARLGADERSVAARIVDACGAPPPQHAGDRAQTALLAALEDAAGVPTVVSAVRESAKRDAHAATGWPLTRWVAGLRRDPLRRLGLRAADRRVPADRPDLVRTSLPAPRPAVRSAASSAVRRYVEEMTDGVADSWVLAARSRAQDGIDELPGALDHAVALTWLETVRRPWWWQAVNVLQWALVTVVVAGLLWLTALFLFAYLQLPSLPTPVWTPPMWTGGEDVVFPGWTPPSSGPGEAVDPFQVPWPTLMVLGGLVLGVLVALVSRLFAAVGARRRAAVARRRLRESVAGVADRLVRQPVGEELAALERCRKAASAAAR